MPAADDTALARALDETVDLCRAGYAANDPSEYARIEALMYPFEGDERVDTMLRLCRGWEGLSSKRFAYPHIQDRAAEYASEIRERTPAAPSPGMA